MLHITNGDSAVRVLHSAGILTSQDELIAWQDVLHEGPVLPLHPLSELSRIRAEYISTQGWGDPVSVQEGFAYRDQAIEQHDRHPETILWFEADLYDQLQLIQILDYFALHDPMPSDLSLICGEQYVSSFTPDQAHRSFQSRRRVTREQLFLAQKSWAAFCESSPRSVEELLQTDLIALPFLKNALERFLEEYPTTKSGLSRSQAQALEAVQNGETNVRQVYLSSHHARERYIFLGDSVFAGYLQSLSQCAEPLVLLENGAPILAPRWNEDAAQFWESHISLTAFGLAVLNGEADQISRNGIDRWLGGVHLQGNGPLWRRDPSTHHLTIQ